MPSTECFRFPFAIAGVPSPSPPEKPTLDAKDINYVGEWHLTRTSNAFWKDKSNVRMYYTSTGDDRFAYTPSGSSTEKQMEGGNMPVPDAPATYTWRGNGFMRLFTARWEIPGFEEKAGGKGWLLTFQHKTIFTAPAVNIACRTNDGIESEDVEFIRDWLKGLGNEGLKKAADDLYMIEHDVER